MDRAIKLVVFADDWGRHPSSAQHLVRELLEQRLVERVVWVNTIGMRRPRLRWGDVKRGLESLRGDSRRATSRRAGVAGGASDDDFGGRLRVVSPRMYPGFRNGWQRRLNAWAMRRAVEAAVSGDDSVERVGLTTLPITADLVGSVSGVDRWVYYCVDDFSVWPGVDHGVMEEMEPELVRKADALVCVSEVLRSRVLGMFNRRGAEDAEVGGGERQDAKTPRRQGVELLTHGVDVGHWTGLEDPGSFTSLGPPKQYSTYMFWGLIDERLDEDWCLRLADAEKAAIGVNSSVDFKGFKGYSGGVGPHLIGPWPDRSDDSWAWWFWGGQHPHAFLPYLASRAAVLIMPYRDVAVTRAMQPLKLLEYLATYKPVVVRDLPATRGWGDCCDVVSTAEDFVRVCRERAEGGLPEGQRLARERRITGESWSEKARVLHRVLRGEGGAGR